MKNTVFLIFLILCEVAVAQKCEQVSFFNSDGTRTVYFCDTVSLTNYVIVESAKTGHQFLIPDSTYQIKKQGVEYWNLEYAFFYFHSITDIYYFGWTRESFEKFELFWKNLDFWPFKNKFGITSNSPQKGKDVLCSFYTAKPTIFLLFFIRGDAINYATYDNVIDGAIKGPLKFKNPYAFYPVYIPYK